MRKKDLIVCKSGLRFLRLGQQALARLSNATVDEFDAIRSIERQLGEAIIELHLFVEQQEKKS